MSLKGPTKFEKHYCLIAISVISLSYQHPLILSCSIYFCEKVRLGNLSVSYCHDNAA